MSNNSPRGVWTAGTVFLLLISLVGTGVFVYCTRRYSNELAVTDELRVEIAALRAVQAKMEKSVDRLDALPPMAGAKWEKALTDQINAAVEGSGARMLELTYSSEMDEEQSGVRIVAFALELEGNSDVQAQCLALLEQGVVGMRFEEIQGMLGGGDPNYLGVMSELAGSISSMRITGKVYCEAGGAS